MNHPTIPTTAPNLYLVGFMGTGKSVVGKRVAEALQLQFIDSDHAIEADEGIPVADIFKTHGEPHFRKLEKQFVEEKQPAHRTVISCGGGLVTNPDLLKQIKSSGVVVVLYAGIDTLMKRIAHDPTRPLMQSDNPRERIESLLKSRESVYKSAGIGIMTDGYTLQQVTDKVIRAYLSGCAL